jgi:hypothetical protein
MAGLDLGSRRERYVGETLVLVDRFAGALGGALDRLREPQPSSARSSGRFSGPLVASRSVNSSGRAVPFSGDLSGQLREALDQEIPPGYSATSQVGRERVEEDEGLLDLDLRGKPELLRGLDSRPADIKASATADLRGAGQDGRLSEQDVAAAEVAVDQVLGHAEWGAGELVRELAVLAALDRVLSPGVSDLPEEGPAPGKQDPEALRRERTRRREDLVRRWVQTSGSTARVDEVETDPESAALVDLARGLTDAVTALSRAWLAPVHAPGVDSTASTQRADGAAPGGSGTSAPVALIRALRDAVREALGTLSASPPRQQEVDRLLRLPSGPFGDAIWDQLGAGVEALRALPADERDYGVQELQRRVDVAGRMLIRMLYPEATLRTQLEHFGQRRRALSAAEIERLVRQDSAAQPVGHSPVRGNWLGRMGSDGSRSARATVGSTHGSVADEVTSRPVVHRDVAPEVGVETWYELPPSVEKVVEIDESAEKPAEKPAEEPAGKKAAGNGKPDPAKLGWTWGVIKGTAQPPDERALAVQRQRELAAMKSAKPVRPGPLPARTRPVPGEPSPLSRMGSADTIGGYADGTSVLSWAELSGQTLAPGVLIRLRSAVPVAASAPTEVAHRAVLVFAKRADGRAPGSEGPYLIQSVVYDKNTDTYYVRLA